MPQFVSRTLLVALAFVALTLVTAPLAAQQCMSCSTIIANSTPTTVTIVGTYPAQDCPWAKMNWEDQVEDLCTYGFCLREDGASPGGCSPCGPSICKWTQQVSYLCEECIDEPPMASGFETADPRVPAFEGAVCATPESTTTIELNPLLR